MKRVLFLCLFVCVFSSGCTTLSTEERYTSIESNIYTNSIPKRGDSLKTQKVSTFTYKEGTPEVMFIIEAPKPKQKKRGRLIFIFNKNIDPLVEFIDRRLNLSEAESQKMEEIKLGKTNWMVRSFESEKGRVAQFISLQGMFGFRDQDLREIKSTLNAIKKGGNFDNTQNL